MDTQCQAFSLTLSHLIRTQHSRIAVTRVMRRAGITEDRETNEIGGLKMKKFDERRSSACRALIVRGGDRAGTFLSLASVSLPLVSLYLSSSKRSPRLGGYSAAAVALNTHSLSRSP